MRARAGADHADGAAKARPHRKQPGTAEPKPPPAARGSGRALFTEQEWEMIGRALKLSGRELQIVQGIADNVKESAIALRLGISTHTVHSHMDRLHHKLQVNGRSEILMRIFREYLEQHCSKE